MAERKGFEPLWGLLPQPISSRCRYDRFGTSPGTQCDMITLQVLRFLIAYRSHMLLTVFRSTRAGFQTAFQAAYSSVCAPASAMAYALPCMAGLLLVACGEPPSILEHVQEQNELIVISRNGPTTYYEGTNGPAGFEYELTKLFADDLGVELSIVVPPNFNDILPLTALGAIYLMIGSALFLSSLYFWSAWRKQRRPTKC